MLRFFSKQCIPIGGAILILTVLYLSTIDKNWNIISIYNKISLPPSPRLSKIDPDLIAGLNEPPENTCKLPNLQVDDPSIARYLRIVHPLRCDPTPNWVFTAGGKFWISADAEKAHGPISCNYTSLRRLRTGRDNFSWRRYEEYDSGSPLLTEGFMVECRSKNGSSYRNVHAGVPLKINVPDRLEKLEASPARTLNLSIYIYSADSMSHVNFRRKCPKTYNLLTKEMGGLAMNGFNIVGDGTPWAFIPMFTGKFQTELPEGRKRFANSSYLDDWPVIFRDFNASGYVTGFSEEMPNYSFWTYKLKGFRDPPADYWLQSYQKATLRNRHWFPEFCQGHEPRSIALCRFWEELQTAYEPQGVKTFTTLLSGETSHDDYNLVQGLDAHWARIFRRQHKAGMFNNTILIFMGDHGRRFGPVRRTQSGKLEEKLPLLVTVMPPWFKTAYPSIWKNLVTNTNRLVTVFDLYATFQNILHFNPTSTPTPAEALVQQRGISLFEEVPAARTCIQASIGTHYCSCLSWETIKDPNSDGIVRRATSYVISQLNNILAEADGACANLSLGSIRFARRMYPNEKLMAFSGPLDIDNIYPEMRASTTVTAVDYEIEFTTQPNAAHFEAVVKHFPRVTKVRQFKRRKGKISTKKKEEFSFKFSDLSRVDMYKGQSDCILNTHQNLRPYCYCTNLMSTSK